MMAVTRSAFFVASIVALHATVAGAQTRRPRTPPRKPGDLTVDVNVGAQVTGDDVTQQFSVAKNAEPASIGVKQPFSAGMFIDAGVTVRARRRLGLAIGVSVLPRERDAAIAASVPHPVFFNLPRAVNGTTRLSQSQTAIHLDAAYLAPPRGRLALTLLGGVSIVHIEQALVTDINIADPYPFDAPSLASAVTQTAAATPVGFNVGLDATWRRWRRAGLGALIRYSRASTTLSAGATGTANVVAGGLQTGVGVRFDF
jgi:hypothetical protein